MPHVHDIIQALKLALKRRGITYSDVAEELSLSESSVKRLFASGGFNLERLQRVCDFAELDIAELVQIAEERRRNVERLSEAQERALVANTKLLLVAFLLLNDWSFDQIVSEYEISQTEGIRLLAKLDRLKIIDLLPGNKARVLLSRTFSWRENGPIQRFFEDRVQSEFFDSRFSAKGEKRLVLNGMLSMQSNRIVQQRIERLAVEFETLIKEDRNLDLEDRRGTTLITAIRPWGLGLFEQLRRKTSSAGRRS